MDGDPTENLGAFERVIRCMKEKGIGYGSVNHPVDRDPVCGFSGIIGDQCPAADAAGMTCPLNGFAGSPVTWWAPGPLQQRQASRVSGTG